MKIFITTAIWGRGYLRTFVDICLASQLAPGNLPRAAREHRIVYHVITTSDDAVWFRAQPAYRALAKVADIKIELIEDLGFDVAAVPTGPEGAKYRFLSILQNVAIERALDQDALIFNYADFVWCDGALSHAIDRLTDGVDAVLTFCLPVDDTEGRSRLSRYADRGPGRAGVLALPPREGARIAVECLHRETKFRYWDDPPFTVTPTYILWRVPDAGLLVRAYHQTILVLRVRADDPEYRRGIVSGSLDSCFTAALAKTGRVAHAADSDVCLVFSLYDTIVDSSIGGASRADWTGYDRAVSLRECLRGVIELDQRAFAKVPIRVRTSDAAPETWARVEARSGALLAEFEANTPFDPWEYERLHTEGTTLEALADQYRATATAALGRALWFLPPAKRRSLVSRARAAYGRLMTRLAGPLAGGIKRVIGPARARALRLALKGALYPNARAPEISRLIRMPDDAEVLALLAEGKIDAALEWIEKSLSDFEIAPGVMLPRRAAACVHVSAAVERHLPDFDDLERLYRILLNAERALRELVALAPQWPLAPVILGRNLWFQGRYQDALAAFARESEFRAALAKLAGWRLDERTLLPANCAEVIGLMGHIDAFAKRRILTGDRRRYVLMVREGQIVNPVFLEYWRTYIDIDVRGANDGGPSPQEAAMIENWNWVLPDDRDELVHVHRGIARIQRRWEAEGRAPLLHLRAEHRALLDRVRAGWGMRGDDWYVCLHVRSSGFYRERPGTAQSFRNSPIEDYHPAIRAIVDAGGWVVRMGDPGMPPLDRAALGPAATRVVDYAHSAEREPALDVALCAQCRLFVSSPSGLHTVAHAFGRPACYVNFPIYAGFPWHPGEIFAPKLYVSKHFGRAMTIEEILSGNLTSADHQFLLEVAGVELRNNSPETIRDTVLEALFPDATAAVAPARAREVRDEFEAANLRHGRDISGRLSLSFAAAHADELLPPARGAAR